MDASKRSFCYPWMQQREVSAIYGCRKGKYLLFIDAAKGSFCYPWMQQRDVSSIHGCRKGSFLLSMDAGKRSFCCPWMQQRELSAIHGCCKEKFLLADPVCRRGLPWKCVPMDPKFRCMTACVFPPVALKPTKKRTHAQRVNIINFQLMRVFFFILKVS